MNNKLFMSALVGSHNGEGEDIVCAFRRLKEVHKRTV